MLYRLHRQDVIMVKKSIILLFTVLSILCSFSVVSADGVQQPPGSSDSSSEDTAEKAPSRFIRFAEDESYVYY